MPTEANDHFQRLARLLNWNRKRKPSRFWTACRNTPGERTGDCLVGLVVIEETSGLGGRFILTLANAIARCRCRGIAWNPERPILLSAGAARPARAGAASSASAIAWSCSVALNEPPGDDDRPASYRLDLSTR